MLERKNYTNVDMAFLFLVGFIDQCTRGMKQALLMKIQRSIPSWYWVWRPILCAKAWSESQLMELKYRPEQFKRSLVRTFSENCNFALYTLKYYLLDQVVQDLQKSNTLSVSHASQFEQYNVNIKHDYRQTSKWRDTCMKKTVGMAWSRMNWTQNELRMLSLEGEW